MNRAARRAHARSRTRDPAERRRLARALLAVDERRAALAERAARSGLVVAESLLVVPKGGRDG